MGGFEQLFDAGRAVTPPLQAEDLAGIPGKRGVFLLVASDGRPILLTTAADIRSRLRSRLTSPEEGTRQKAADLREITAHVYWRICHSSFQTDWQFLELAGAIWPKTYTSLLSHPPAWFVGVNPEEEFPQFVKTQEIGQPGQQVGPFPDRSSAERFIDALTDSFDLCRYYSILRQAPHGVPCPYKQMGRSPAPCDGSIPMSVYRDMIRSACGFAAGDRGPLEQSLSSQMQQAAAALQFERAGTFKARLGRLKDFDAPQYAFVREAGAFRFVIVQSGPTSHQACTFVCDRGLIAQGPVLEYPPSEESLRAVLAACDELSARHGQLTLLDRQRMGLVTAYLFCGPAKRGLLVRRDDIPDPAALRHAIEAAAEDLKLRVPVRRRKEDG